MIKGAPNLPSNLAALLPLGSASSQLPGQGMARRTSFSFQAKNKPNTKHIQYACAMLMHSNQGLWPLRATGSWTSRGWRLLLTLRRAGPAGNLPLRPWLTLQREEAEDVSSKSPSPFGEPPASPLAIRRALAKQPKLSSPTEKNLEEAVFWTHRHLPAGSVVEVQNPYQKAWKLRLSWLRWAGCFNRVAKHWNLGESQGFGGRHRRGEKGGHKVFQMRKAKATPLQLHGWRRRYRRLPPVEIQVVPPWRNSRGLPEQSSCKRSGKRPRNGAEELREPPPSRPGTGPSTAEKRLGALLRIAGSTEFPLPMGRGAAEDTRGAKDGTGGRHRSSASQEANQLAIVKKEVIPSESEKEDKKKKKKASKLSDTLARAAQLRNAVDQRKPRKKSRSR